LHVVDFGDRACMPGLVRQGFDSWLGLFDVHPRAELPDALRCIAARIGGEATIEPLFRGYALYGRIALPATARMRAAAAR
jgi:S-adenosylmethionine-diacylgycerolhomoserine-N-methlytransferase